MFPPVYCTQLRENIGSDVAYIAERFFPPVAADIGKLSILLCETIQRTRS